MRYWVGGGALIALGCAAGGGRAGAPTASSPPTVSPASSAPAAVGAASAAKGATSAPGPSGTCTASAESEAQHQAEQEQRHVRVVIEAGRIVEASDYSGSQAMGGSLGRFSGAGPALHADAWIDVPMTTRPAAGPSAELDPAQPASTRKLRFRVSGSSWTVEGGPSGQCEWTAAAPPAKRGAGSSGPAADAPEPKLEQPEPGRVVVRVGGAALDCTAHHAAHAALTQCQIQGAAGKATIGWGMSDETDRVMCSRSAQKYDFEHGGGWDAGKEHFRRIAPEGARVVLGQGVEVWLGPRLAKLELSSGRRSVELEVDLEGSAIKARTGSVVPRASAKLLLDLGDPAKSPESCSGD